MPFFKKNARRAVLLPVVASLMLFGCSGDKPKTEQQKAEEALKSKFDDENLIRANIAVRAYEQGRLGTREQVEADMEPFFSPRDYTNKIPKPFDSSGRLIPLSAMNDEQLSAFSQWYTSDKVYAVLRDETNAAIIAFREKKAGKKD